MTYALTHLARQTLAQIVAHQGGATLLLERPKNCVQVLVIAEQEGAKLALSISHAGSHSTLNLQAGDSANTQHAADYIEALANGTAETAETGAIGRPSATAREPVALSEHDEARLRSVTRIGGTRHLECGPSITVHNTLQSQRRDALVTTPAGTAHLHAGTPAELYVALAQHIEAALNAA